MSRSYECPSPFRVSGEREARERGITALVWVSVRPIMEEGGTEKAAPRTEASSEEGRPVKRATKWEVELWFTGWLRGRGGTWRSVVGGGGRGSWFAQVFA